MNNRQVKLFLLFSLLLLSAGPLANNRLWDELNLAKAQTSQEENLSDLNTLEDSVSLGQAGIEKKNAQEFIEPDMELLPTGPQKKSQFRKRSR